MLKIYSRPSDPRSSFPPVIVYEANRVSGDRPNATLNCSRTQDINTGIIHILAQWSLPCDKYLFQAIENFVIWEQLDDVSRQERIVKAITRHMFSPVICNSCIWSNV